MTSDSWQDLALARETLSQDGLCFVLVKQGEILGSGRRDGVGEILEQVQALQEGARGAALADKIVGKAVAMIVLHARISAVYSPLASEPAKALLAGAGIQFEYQRLVPNILNRRGTGLCPRESLVLNIMEPQKAMRALRLWEARKEYGLARKAEVI